MFKQFIRLLELNVGHVNITNINKIEIKNSQTGKNV